MLYNAHRWNKMWYPNHKWRIWFDPFGPWDFSKWRRLGDTTWYCGPVKFTRFYR